VRDDGVSVAIYSRSASKYPSHIVEIPSSCIGFSLYDHVFVVNIQRCYRGVGHKRILCDQLGPNLVGPVDLVDCMSVRQH
jgi:hypothetical protein